MTMRDFDVDAYYRNHPEVANPGLNAQAFGDKINKDLADIVRSATKPRLDDSTRLKATVKGKLTVQKESEAEFQSWIIDLAHLKDYR
mgnify:CR=1 FL=1